MSASPTGMNGRLLADAAKQLRPELKVLFVTGGAENAIRDPDRSKHGMQVVTNPRTMAELALRAEAIISGD